MSLLNQHWIGLAGEPVTGMTPTRMLVESTPPGLAMSPQQEGALSHAYKLFCTAVANSLDPKMFHTQHRTYGENMTSTMTSLAGVHTVRVAIRGSRVPLVCPRYISGLFLYGWNAVRSSTTAPGTDTLYYSASAGDADSAGYRGFQVLPFQYPPMAAETHGADFEKLRLPFLTHHRDHSPDLTPPPPNWTHYTDHPQLAVVRPGLYSGTMRAVIQYMLGAASPIKFDYHHGCTHGIANVPGRDGPVPWVVEISAAQGVLACRLKLCQRPGKYSALGYTPLGADLPCAPGALDALIASGRVVRLLSAAQMAPFYAFSAVFSECGWAFSYTGLEAQNTGTGMAPGNVYQTAQRYKVTLAHDGGKLTGAALALVDQGFMIGNPGVEFARSQVRIPNYALQGCVTMDMKPAVLGAHSEDSICPIYVYYDGDAEQVVTWWNEKLVPNPDPGWPAWSTFNPNTSGAFNRPYHFLGDLTGAKSHYYQIKSPLFPSPQMFTQEGDMTSYTPVPNGNGFMGYKWAAPGAYGMTSVYSLTVYTVLVGTPKRGTIGSRHTVTIPLYEREMIYHMREEIEETISAGIGSFGMTRLHTNAPAENWVVFKDIDALGNPFGPNIWTYHSTSPGNTSPDDYGSYEGAFSEAWSGGPGGDSTGTGGYTTYASIPRNNTTVIPAPSTTPPQADVKVGGSDFGAQSVGLHSTSEQWYKIQPDMLGGVSQLWVARSVDGLYIVPKKDRYPGMNSADYLLSLNGYPDSIVNQAPWAVFVGSAADKVQTPAHVPPNYPLTFSDPRTL